MVVVIGNFIMGALAVGLFWATTSIGRGGNNHMTGAPREAKTV